MAIQATVRKIKRSFTLAPEVAAFVTETRARRRAGSDSEALNLLLRESMLAAMKGSLAGMVNGTSAFFVKDIYQAFIRPDAKTRELIAASWLSTARC